MHSVSRKELVKFGCCWFCKIDPRIQYGPAWLWLARFEG